MVVSILHRATAVALSFAGLGMLTWWLMALSSAPDAYLTFTNFIGWLTGSRLAEVHGAGWVPALIGLLIGVGLTWSFFQHLLSGIRHLVMDTGAAFELGVNKTFAHLTIVGSVALTAVLWFYLLGGAK